MENLERKAKIQSFVSSFAAGAEFNIKPITSDASLRKYYRATFSNRPDVIILDDEKLCCKTPEFVELSFFLRSHGACVPEVLSQNIAEGLLILEDLGNNSVHNLLTPDNEKDFYLKSARALAKVTNIVERPSCAKTFGKKELLHDVRLFTDWYIPMSAGHPLSEKDKKDFLDLIDTLSNMAFKVPNRLMLWDYHIDNIMLPPHSQECAIIDFQDAMWGPLTYDIVSLLAADRRTASPETITATKDAFFAMLDGVDRSDFDDSFAFMSMYRHMRVLGRFTTLTMVNRKEKYFQYIPQTWAMLEHALQRPKLLPIKQWVDKHVPPQSRVLPSRKPINSAIILAAGRGSRMQSITDNLPKPLVKVGNKPLIDYNFERLFSANIDNIVVNLCYKGDMIRTHLNTQYPEIKITFSEEETALETGGGVKNALPLLKGDVFFVCNSDVFFIDTGYKPALWRMMDEWDSQKYDILLLLQPVTDICGDKNGDYRINSAGMIERNLQKSPDFPYMFGGISIVSRKVFNNVAETKFSLRDLFDVAQNNNKLGFVINSAQFYHVGTPEALAAAEAKIKRNK
ncbi:MAG: phosphotransferase [Rhodospirillales bacterium]|nr:phosphotransferase [Rhodospirillales bacterium]